MGVYIKGMDKPECCATCHFNHETYLLSRHICIANRWKEIRVNRDTGFPDDCPLVEIKEPHGDLVDRNALMKKANVVYSYDGSGMEYEYKAVSDLSIAAAPIVLEAEGNDGKCLTMKKCILSAAPKYDPDEFFSAERSDGR